MKKVIFFDRDGTLIWEPEDNFQIDRLDKLKFLPQAISSLKKLSLYSDFEFVMITNQDGLGTASFPESDFWPAHKLMLEVFESEGISFADILIDRSFPEQKLATRKPGTGLLTKYLTKEYDLANSWVIGDRLTDVELAKNLKSKSIYMGSEQSLDATFCSNDWTKITDFILQSGRNINFQRDTKETKISILLNLDGQGQTQIKTGLSFFDHMLQQLAFHAGFDLNLNVIGDLEIDEHHTIEDTALALGEAIIQALGTKRGINRYGFTLPMDDALVQVALDFSGRPWLVWQAEFKREKVGDMPTEMFSHFFKSFSDSAKCNLNIKIEGDNEHHKIEATFKALGKAIKQAVTSSGQIGLPSTKGLL